MRRFLITLLCLSPWLAQAQLESTSDLNRGLVGWWRFNEGTGTNAFDLSGNGNTGTLSGSTLPVWTNGVFEGALWFDGTNTYVNIGTNSFIRTTFPFTVSLWAKRMGYTFGSGNNFPILLASNTDQTENWRVSFSDSAAYADICFGSAGSFSRLHGLSGGTTTNIWYSIAVTYNGAGSTTAGNFKLYVNGVQETLSVANPFGSETGNGSIASNLAQQQLLGFIDDVRIYSRALSATEVLNLYCQGGGRTP